MRPEQNPFYGNENYQTVWDTFDTPAEVYEALIAPIEHSIAWACKSLVNSRTGSGHTFDVWQDIYQEAIRTLLVMLCTRYKQKPKPGGVTIIPHSHVKNAVIDAARMVLGGSKRYPQRASEFENSMTRTHGVRGRIWNSDDHENKDSRLGALLSTLEDSGIIEPGKFTIEDVEEAGFIVSEAAARNRVKKGETAGELWLQIHAAREHGRETIKELASESATRRAYVLEEAQHGW